jgi:hypothetical protein
MSIFHLESARQDGVVAKRLSCQLQPLHVPRASAVFRLAEQIALTIQRLCDGGMTEAFLHHFRRKLQRTLGAPVDKS